LVPPPTSSNQSLLLHRHEPEQREVTRAHDHDGARDHESQQVLAEERRGEIGRRIEGYEEGGSHLLAKADRLLEKGDIVAARAVYQRAAEMGSAAAALTLGATYDPNRLWSLGALGMVGNRDRARQWYARASELGHPEAKVRLLALGN
jgi:hypothetical protein